MSKFTAYETIQEGMKLIHEGCKVIDDWEDCWTCPFVKYCQPETHIPPYWHTPAEWTDTELYTKEYLKDKENDL